MSFAEQTVRHHPYAHNRCHHLNRRGRQEPEYRMLEEEGADHCRGAVEDAQTVVSDADQEQSC